MRYFVDGYKNITDAASEYITKLPAALSYIFEQLAHEYTLYYGDDGFFGLTELSDQDKEVLLSDNELIHKSGLEFRTKLNIIRFKIAENYVFLSFFKIANIQLDDNSYRYLPDKGKSADYLYRTDYEFFLYKTGRAMPFRLKDLCGFDYGQKTIYNSFFQAYLEFLGQDNLLAKDLLRDFKADPMKLNVPFSLIDIKDVKNKVMLLEKRKLQTYKSFNNNSLCYSYSLAKALPRIPENMVSAILQQGEFQLDYVKEKDRTKEFLIKFYEFAYNRITKYDMKTKKGDAEYHAYSNMIRDYIELVFLLKDKQVKLPIRTLSRLRKEHDKVMLDVLDKQQKKAGKNSLILKKNSLLYGLKLPENFIPIKHEAELKAHGIAQKNCVYTRLQQVLSNASVIYSLNYKDKIYTLELRWTKKRYTKYIVYNYECRGFANSAPSQDVFDYINSQLELVNDEINKDNKLYQKYKDGLKKRQ